MPTEEQSEGATGVRKLIRSTTSSTLTALAANGTVTIPAGYMIEHIIVNNTTGNAVTGGVKVGTTSGGVDVVVALTVGANALVQVFDAAILKRIFSLSVDSTLYVQAVAAWNSASLSVYFVLRKII